MRSATVTWITYNNYGTLLQAYALQQYLVSIGIENEIISDEIILKEFHKTQNIQKKPDCEERDEFKEKNIIKRLPRILMVRMNKKKYILPYEGSQKLMENFKACDLVIRYGETLTSIYELSDKYDVFLCGSDQVWSVNEDIFNPFYYLNFTNKIKISYAPSLGLYKIPEGLKEKIKVLLSDFSKISVREQCSANYLTRLLNRKVEWTADPTLLANREFWEKFSKNESDINYIVNVH